MAIRTTYSLTEFYNSVRDKINELNPKVTFWGEGSVIRAVAQAVAHKFHYMQFQLNVIYMSSFIRTAKGLHLERLVANFGMSRKSTTYAGAIVEFLGDSGRTTTITVPAGTTVSRDSDYFGNIVSYELAEDIIMTSGTVSASGLCIATDVGTIGNCPSGSIINLEDSVTGISGCINYYDVVSGADLESDESLRARVPEYLLGLSGGNKSAILSKVRAIEGITYVDIKENFPTVGNFTIYVATADGILDLVTLEKVRNAVELSKGYTITYTIVTPTSYPILITFDLTFDNSTIESAKQGIKEAIQAGLQQYVNKLATPNLYRSDVISFVKQYIGVKNIKNVLIDGLAQDLELNSLYVIKINDVSNITITEV